MRWIKKSMEEAPGVPSSVRLQMMIVTVSVAVVFLGLSIGVAFGTIKDIPAGVVSFGTLIFAGASAAKVYQHKSE